MSLLDDKMTLGMDPKGTISYISLASCFLSAGVIRWKLFV